MATPVPVPTPIGAGPAYRPPPGLHAPCTRAPLRAGARIHLELFAHGRVVIVPARIGVGKAGCRARLWTTEPTGVVRFTGPARLGDLFRVWGLTLRPSRLLGFGGAVRLYRNGARRHGDPRTLVLHDGDEIVLEVGPFVLPHHSYLFPPE